MLKKALSEISFVTVVFLSVACASCFDQTEEITVDEDGTTTIVARFTGDVDNFRPPVALPSEPEWTILERNIDSSDIDAIEMELEAKLVIPYGTPLPQTYAKADAPDKEVHLQFPTKVRYWSEGNRTFYEFKRTYLARSYDCYDITRFLTPRDLWDQELENRILEKGIFNVSEKDRTEYLDRLVAVYGYLHWRFLWETLAGLVRREEIPISTKENVETWAADYLESVLTPVSILGILGKDDDSIGIALDRLEDELHHQFAEYFSATVGADRIEVQQDFADLFHTITLGYDVTKALGAREFSIALTLPGTIVKANGLVDHQKPGIVEWYFKGEDLHDRDMPLYALSIVEH